MSLSMQDPSPEPRHLVADALRYAAKGLAVFPLHGVNPDGSCGCGRPGCPSAGKHPVGDLVPHGVQEATTDPGLIREWWATYPDANIAIACGTRSGLIVVDVDADRGGHETLAALEEVHEPLPQTWTVKTGGGGEHRYFSLPADGDFRNSANTVGSGIDIRANNGYVVAPPSLHASGTRYAWSALAHPRFVERAILPEWIAEKLTKPAPERPAVKRDDFAARMSDETIQKIIKELRPHWREGSRHALALAVSALFAKAGVPEEQTDDLIADLAANDDDPRDRMIAVRTSYERVRLGQPTQGFTALSGHLPQPLIDWLDKQADHAREAAKPTIKYTIKQGQSAGSTGPRDDALGFTPNPIPATCLRGWIGEYVAMMTPLSESDPAFHLASSLALIGATFGRAVKSWYATKFIYPNGFYLLVGAAGSSRKDTAIGMMLDAPYWQAPSSKIITAPPFHIETDAASGPGFVKTLSEHPNVLFYVTEYARLVNNMNIQNSSLRSLLISAWDMPRELKNSSIGNPLTASAPTVTIISASQPEILADLMTRTDVEQGYANRWLFFPGVRHGVLPDPPRIDERQAALLYRELLHAKNDYGAFNDGTELPLAPDGLDLWRTWYVADEAREVKNGAESSMRSRLAAHIRKTALIYAASEHAIAISAEHLVAAMDLVEWCWSHTQKLMATWGSPKISKLCVRIERALERHGPMPRREIQRRCQNSDTPLDVKTAIQTLEYLGKIVSDPNGVIALIGEE